MVLYELHPPAVALLARGVPALLLRPHHRVDPDVALAAALEGGHARAGSQEGAVLVLQ